MGEPRGESFWESIPILCPNVVSAVSEHPKKSGELFDLLRSVMARGRTSVLCSSVRGGLSIWGSGAVPLQGPEKSSSLKHTFNGRNGWRLIYVLLRAPAGFVIWAMNYLATQKFWGCYSEFPFLMFSYCFATSPLNLT